MNWKSGNNELTTSMGHSLHQLLSIFSPGQEGAPFIFPDHDSGTASFGLDLFICAPRQKNGFSPNVIRPLFFPPPEIETWQRDIEE